MYLRELLIFNLSFTEYFLFFISTLNNKSHRADAKSDDPRQSNPSQIFVVNL